MQLRNYQIKVIDYLNKNLIKHEENLSCLISLPTGAGKTITAGELIHMTGLKTIFTAHRLTLVRQTANVFTQLLHKEIGVYSGEQRTLCDVTVGTVQSISKEAEMFAEDFDLLIIDEVHWGQKAEMIKALKSAFISKGKKVIGMSATPIDSNDYLIEGYDDYFMDVQIGELVSGDYLIKPEYYKPAYAKVDLSDVKVTAGDYNVRELSSLMQKEEIINAVNRAFGERCLNKLTVVYCVDIEHAKRVYDSLAGKYPEVKFGIIHSQLDARTVYDTITTLSNRKLGCLINVDMLTAGWDCPELECLILARPTKRLSLFMQIGGRLLRKAPNKSQATFIDCGNNLEEHGLLEVNRKFSLRTKYGKTLDRILKVDDTPTNKVSDNVHPIFTPTELKQIGHYIDLFMGKVYHKEQQIIEDLKTFLAYYKQIGKVSFYWRQNSGKACMNGKWVNFTDIKGLPDLVIFIFNSIYIGIEVKLPTGYLKDTQRETLPEMKSAGLNVHIVTNVIELFRILEYYLNGQKPEDYPEEQIAWDAKLKYYQTCKKKYNKLANELKRGKNDK